MTARINMTGLKYGRLLVLEETGKKVSCRCDCGEEKTFTRGNILAGYTNSCGCLHVERSIKANLKHGETGSDLYQVWKLMHRRCKDKKCRQYPWYGGKGISVCERWKDYSLFKLDMEQGYSKGLTLDRKDSNDDYYKDNCRWLTKSQNSAGGC